jgi:hypothetical protein
MLTTPLHDTLDRARTVLIAGAGGGFDVFSGLPLYFALRAAGKAVHLANLTFSNIPLSAGRRPVRELVEITAESDGSTVYFPEKHLSGWFADRDERVPVWAIERFGPAAVARAYRALVDELRPDTIVLVDGGTDSLMRGDESGLGTPVEDVSSIAAVDALPDVERRLLVCLGFGIDAFHGVSHVDVLEAVADLSRAGGYLGAISLANESDECRLFRQATEYVLRRTPSRRSIVCTSILSALEGRFGDHHDSDRTEGSELFVNPLMSIYWCFVLDAVARRNLYLNEVRQIEGFYDTERAITQFRARLPATKPFRSMPL